MKRLKTIVTLALCYAAFVLNPLQAQTNLEEFILKWDNGKAFTLDVVDKMPEELLNYKPHDTAMSFTEQVTHLSSAIVGISQGYLNGGNPGFQVSVKPTNKAELKAFVAQCFDYGKETFSNLTELELAEKIDIFGMNGSRRQVISLIDDHVTHHRGAAISYIRANGIEPPRFRGM
ncbi:DinB family protein [Belliella pelovolcani]|uniref:DinB family protein n=1 Tax=Belliella pelovolcani TaxID=529505 RepID=UPI003918B518